MSKVSESKYVPPTKKRMVKSENNFNGNRKFKFEIKKHHEPRYFPHEIEKIIVRLEKTENRVNEANAWREYLYKYRAYLSYKKLYEKKLKNYVSKMKKANPEFVLNKFPTSIGIQPFMCQEPDSVLYLQKDLSYVYGTDMYIGNTNYKRPVNFQGCGKTCNPKTREFVIYEAEDDSLNKYNSEGYYSDYSDYSDDYDIDTKAEIPVIMEEFF